MTAAGSIKKLPFEVSALAGARFYFSWQLPFFFGPPEGRDLGRVEDLLAYFIDFVNASPVVVDGKPSELIERFRSNWNQTTAMAFGGIQESQRELRELMQMAVDGRLAKPSDEFLADIQERFRKGTVWSMQLERVPRGAVLGHDVHVGAADGVYALLAVLLMDQRYRDLARRCPQCGKLFMKAGKRRFCTENCATAANDAGVAMRQRHRRLRLAAQELLPNVASAEKRASVVSLALKQHPDVTTPEQLAEHAKALLIAPRKHK